MLFVISSIFNPIYSQRRNSKRAASTGRSTKRAATSGRSTKRAATTGRSTKRAASNGRTSQRAGRSTRRSATNGGGVEVRTVNTGAGSTSEVANAKSENTFSSADIEELKNLISANSDAISNIQGKMTMLDEFESLKSRLVALEEFKNNFSTNTNSSTFTGDSNKYVDEDYAVISFGLEEASSRWGYISGSGFTEGQYKIVQDYLKEDIAILTDADAKRIAGVSSETAITHLHIVGNKLKRYASHEYLVGDYILKLGIDYSNRIKTTKDNDMIIYDETGNTPLIWYKAKEKKVVYMPKAEDIKALGTLYSKGEVPSEPVKDGYIKGTTDLCQGKDYCSVALNSSNDYTSNGASACVSFYYDTKLGWRFDRKLMGFVTQTGERLYVNEWIKDKPDLFVMKDFSHYIESTNLEKVKRYNNTIVICGKGFGKQWNQDCGSTTSVAYANTNFQTNKVTTPNCKFLYNILDSEIDFWGPKDPFKDITSLQRPFTSPNKDLVLFRNGDSKAVLRYNYEKDSLEYLPQISDEEAKKLYYSVIHPYSDREETFKKDRTLSLQSGRYEVEVAGGGGGAGGNCFLNWGKKGGHGGVLKTSFIVDIDDVNTTIKVGNGGKGGSSGCKGGSDGGTSSITVGSKVYTATGGKAGSGMHGASKDKRASNGSCSPSGCTGNADNGGGLGDALKGGKGGSQGWVKIKGLPLKINILGDPVN